ncbi:flagellar biosynthetic protein FliR [Marinitoga hydrogenitolerans DSM 16785]|uniref:Flagellar biosynthetic protein FliR n=1 Tax=Marinitoga hydrogenitolerans (strain DSM 16785 / JCM 12826 / AT1271) TaxID=1122195 RepID=A0A1M4X575_MARH1|nr:flagellar biosynthetic protein FliR [Marinitoga hydrogenitolerans]SHE88654.1 flagellar biosynthetic protein FliR [Marinitoga hydrogenitolerans DSM 16785]
MDIVTFLETRFWVWAIIFFRILGLSISAPIIGSGIIPFYLRVFSSVFISWITLPLITLTIPDLPTFYLITIMLINFFLGILIGLVSYLPIAALQFAGQFFAFQMGFALAGIFDPISGEESPIIGQLAFLIGIFAFLSFKMHIVLFQTIINSFYSIPLVFSINIKFFPEIISTFGKIFEIGAQLALPMSAFMLSVNISLGIVSRMIPQINVFIVGLPLNILVGTLILLSIIGVWVEIFSINISEIIKWINSLITLISK